MYKYLVLKRMLNLPIYKTNATCIYKNFDWFMQPDFATE